jgi:hypothetical protein
VVDLDETQRAAVLTAGRVKATMVAFANSPPYERHLRRLLVDSVTSNPDVADPHVHAVERLLFEFRYDDDTSVIDRFLRSTALTNAERDVVTGFTQGVDGFFEVLADTPPGALAFEVRCCLSDLTHVVAPTLRAGLPALSRGSFLAGRLNPIAGTDLWTPSGAAEMLPASRREQVAELVMELALQAPWLTHRNPKKARTAAEHVARMHERFIVQHGSDVIVVEGKNLGAIYAEAVAPIKNDTPDDVARAHTVARRTIEDSELAHADHVAMVSHPVAGFSFYQDFECITRALEAGAGATSDDLDVVRSYLDDAGVPTWFLRRIIEERLPTSSATLAQALQRPDFDWERDGDQLLAATPGDGEPTLTLAIVPSLCVPHEHRATLT